MAEGALSGIKVIELGEMVSAPFCAKLFADYGADVVKVEPPGGDVARQWGPFPDDQKDPEKSGLFHFLNTNKRGVRLDVATSEGRDRFLALIEDADVLIENQAPARMHELGLDWAALSAVNPDLVMISITPFGQTGPYADWKSYDLNAYHLTGASSRYCGRPGEAPLEHGTFAADFFGAVSGAAWGLAATLGRDNSAGGQQVDVSSAEAIAASFVGGQNIGGYAQDGKFDKRTGVGMPLAAPASIVPCKDGHVWMLALEPGQWNGLREVMGDPEWMQLEMFQDMFVRGENADLIYSMVEEWSAEHGKMEIMERCQAAGCPITAVFTVREAAEHPHLRERGYVIELENDRLGRYRSLGAPFKLSQTPGGPERAAPRLGEHDDEVLADLSTPSRGEGPSGDTGKLPLEGLRVANFGWVWAGPVTGQTLGFLGADVLKIESHARIDMTRTLPPFAGGERDPNRSLSNNACWAGNGSVSLNLKKPEARQLALELIAQSDVVVENFGPGVMERLGLGYEELKRVKPDIIMFSMPAAGLYGPLKDVRTYGLSLTSTTGLDSLVGYAEGDIVPVENAFSDPFNGIFGAFAILTAVAHHKRTGQGQQIDFSQQEAVMQMVGPAFMDYALNGRVAGPKNNQHPLNVAAPHGVFPCAGDDRWISLVVMTDSDWGALVEAMDSPDWATAPGYATMAGRLADIDALHERIAAWTAGFDDRTLSQRLQDAGVAAAPVLTVADLLEDPHYKARETFIEVDHPLGYRETIYGAYVKLGRSRPDVRPGPWIGQDNDRVFKGLLGLDEARYQALKDDEVIH
ncbi:MAG: CoA transferase [Deltaproteobacteria bacterium]|nr:CoA transferase [Deltaproteobacteria bacterium]MBW2383526.1 CoA transferase [Deltaproteobacteria bacterium]MBW2695594.1 CoA transferase [Deltaproteobacteria bacterium]